MAAKITPPVAQPDGDLGRRLCEAFATAFELGYKQALVIGSEKLTDFTDWTDRSTCVLLGDGAGAAVLATGWIAAHEIVKASDPLVPLQAHDQFPVPVPTTVNPTNPRPMPRGVPCGTGRS